MKSIGRHILVELKDCNSKILNDVKKVEEIMVMAAEKSKSTILNVYSHSFEPQGTTCVVALQESHISIHSWPELNYAAVDIFTCGKKMKPQVAVNYLITKFKSKNPLVSEIKRGMISKKKLAKTIIEKI